MEELSRYEKIDLIKKEFKKYPNFLEMYLFNYEESDLFIFINYIKKTDSYRLNWFDLSLINKKNIIENMSCVYVSRMIIDLMREEYKLFDIDLDYHEELDEEDEDIVIFKVDVQTKKSNCINMSFKKYIPLKYECIYNIIHFIFDNIPFKYDDIFNELIAELTDSKEKYEYKKPFTFDLINGNLDELFDKVIIEKGETYYKDSKVLFLEKIENRYFAIVSGQEKYVVIIDYDEEKNKTKFYCSCPCEFHCKHIYAVIKAIRDSKYKTFYKIEHIDYEEDLLSRIFNYEYYLCIGARKGNFEIINQNGVVEEVPIIFNNKVVWKVIEDDKKSTLSKQVDKYIKNK